MPDQLLPTELDLLLQYGRGMLLDYATPDCCILATGVAIDVLSAFGYQVKPIKVRLTIFNQRYRTLVEQHRRLPANPAELQRWCATGAWSVGVGVENDAQPGRWPGHLVALVNETWLLDLSLDQANRPAHDIFLTPIARRVPLAFRYGQDTLSFQLRGSYVTYSLARSDESYQGAPDWQEDRRSPIARRLIDVITGIRAKTSMRSS